MAKAPEMRIPSLGRRWHAGAAVGLMAAMLAFLPVGAWAAEQVTDAPLVQPPAAAKALEPGSPPASGWPQRTVHNGEELDKLRVYAEHQRDQIRDLYQRLEWTDRLNSLLPWAGVLVALWLAWTAVLIFKLRAAREEINWLRRIYGQPMSTREGTGQDGGSARLGAGRANGR